LDLRIQYEPFAVYAVYAVYAEFFTEAEEKYNGASAKYKFLTRRYFYGKLKKLIVLWLNQSKEY
jgi:hypothetical protein